MKQLIYLGFVLLLSIAGIVINIHAIVNHLYKNEMVFVGLAFLLGGFGACVYSIVKTVKGMRK